MFGRQTFGERQSLNKYFSYQPRLDTYSSSGSSTACTPSFSLDANSCATHQDEHDARDEESTSSSPDVPDDAHISTGVGNQQQPLSLPRRDHADVQSLRPSPQLDELGEILQELAHDMSCPYLRQLTHPTLLAACRLGTTLPTPSRQANTSTNTLAHASSSASPSRRSAHIPNEGPNPAGLRPQQTAVTAHQRPVPLLQFPPAAGARSFPGHKHNSHHRRTSGVLFCTGYGQVGGKDCGMYGTYSTAEQIRSHGTRRQLLVPQPPLPAAMIPGCGHVAPCVNSCFGPYASSADQWLS